MSLNFKKRIDELVTELNDHGHRYYVLSQPVISDADYDKKFRELEALEKEHPEFKFIPVLSRDNPGWTGRNGYVHPVYEELFSDKRPAHFYICGWPDMIKEARQRIEAMGYEKKRIRFELYD